MKITASLKKAQEVGKCPPARINCGVCMHVLVYSFAGWSVFFLRVEFIQLCDEALQTAKGTCNQVIYCFPKQTASLLYLQYTVSKCISIV